MQNLRSKPLLSCAFRNRYISKNLSLTTVYREDKDTKLVPGSINQFVRVFGHKTEKHATRNGNLILDHRRRLRRAIKAFIFSPIYAVPLFFQEVSIPMLGAIDAVSPCLMLAAWQIYSLALLKDYKSQYPLVHKVLFNPYDGGVALMREQWAHAANPLRNRRPKLELFYIPHEESHMYKSVGTTLPEGCVIQDADIQISDGKAVSMHHGFIHSDVILNEIAFDNYTDELLASSLMNDMIDLRFQKDSILRLPDISFGKNAEFVERDQASERFQEARKRRDAFADRMMHPSQADQAK